jgi:hypothetical protein
MPVLIAVGGCPGGAAGISVVNFAKAPVSGSKRIALAFRTCAVIAQGGVLLGRSGDEHGMAGHPDRIITPIRNRATTSEGGATAALSKAAWVIWAPIAAALQGAHRPMVGRGEPPARLGVSSRARAPSRHGSSCPWRRACGRCPQAPRSALLRRVRRSASAESRRRLSARISAPSA